MTIGERIKNRRKELKLSADNVAEKLNVSRSTVFRYENGDIEKFPTQKLAEIAKALQTTPGYLMGWSTENEMSIIDVYKKLNTARQKIVYDCAINQLDQQNSKIHDIDDYRQEYTVNIYGSVSAGTGEYLGDGTPEPVTIEGPIPRFDFAVRVHGDSMQPTFDDGQIIFVNKVEKVDEVRNNQFVIAEINGEAFIKKLFVSYDCIKLISLNRNYEDIVIHDYDDYRIIGVVVI